MSQITVVWLLFFKYLFSLVITAKPYTAITTDNISTIILLITNVTVDPNNDF